MDRTPDEASRRAVFEQFISGSPFECNIKRFDEHSAWPGNYVDVAVDLAWQAWIEVTQQSMARITELTQQVERLSALVYTLDCEHAEMGARAEATEQRVKDLERSMLAAAGYLSCGHDPYVDYCDKCRPAAFRLAEQRAQMQRVELSEFKRQAQVQPLSEEQISAAVTTEIEPWFGDTKDLPVFSIARAIERACAEAWGVKVKEDSNGSR